LFENFTALDAFGPAEVLNRVEEWQTRFLSINGGIIKNRQGISILTEPTTEEDMGDIWLIPGRWGTRQLVNDEHFLSQWSMSVLDFIVIHAHIVLV
jgi:aromatic ring-cleaving dioxygenase